jgi:hypothetical protein
VTQHKPKPKRSAPVDPFGERLASPFKERLHVLGGLFEFESNSKELLSLVRSAYAGLPRQRLAAVIPRFQVKLMLVPERQGAPLPGEPPAPALYAGAGFLCGVAGAATFVSLFPAERVALVVVSRDMLAYPYHVRYELIEFAVFTLATRVQGLAPLHAACVGWKRRGLLLAGDSGSGKSTLTLHCLLEGFDFLSEDSVFVTPDSLRATGVGNFLHVRADSLRFVARARERAAIERSPVIRRRSGVEKFEVDVRRLGQRIARNPLELAAVIFPTVHSRADAAPLLRPLRKREWQARLDATQPYGVSRPEWPAFRRSIARLPAFELFRGSHPAEGVDSLRHLLESL